jgi:hypothetical protein
MSAEVKLAVALVTIRAPPVDMAASATDRLSVAFQMPLFRARSTKSAI